MGIYMWRRERAEGPPCESAVYIWGYLGLCAWRERGRGEGEGGGGGERGRGAGGERITTLGQNHSASTAHQSIDTTSKKL
jgi:hypothetical protein